MSDPGSGGIAVLSPLEWTPAFLSFGDRMPGDEDRTVEFRLRAAVESSPSGLLMVDPRGRIVLVNREIERLFGYSREELLGKSVDLLVPEELREGHEGFRHEFLSAPKVRAMGAGRDLYGRHKDGGRVPLEIGLTPVATEEGMFVLSAIVDISARKNAEAERARLEHKLRQAQKMEAVGTLAGGIAHDFNNILGAILGFAELLRDAVRGEQGREDLEELIRFTQRGKDLVEKVQAFGRPRETQRRPLSLEAPLREVKGFLRSSLPPTIEITTTVHSGTPRILADPSAMQQVFMNLGMNAAHAMPEGGRLSIEAEPFYLTDSRAREHPELAEGSYVVVSVQDTGTGMDPEVRSRAFEPFFTTKGTGQGSGLGLAIVHGVVREHGGTVDLESEVGRGTTVRLTLPAAALELAEDEPVTAPMPRGSGEKILYVDDEPGLAAVGKRRLEALGYKVVVASDGDEALERFRASPDTFAAVISDYLMPGRNGLEVAIAISAIRPDLPFIILTGFIDNLPAETISAAGVAELVRKPATSEDLAGALARVLGREGQG